MMTNNQSPNLLNPQEPMKVTPLQMAELLHDPDATGLYYCSDDLKELWVALDKRTPNGSLSEHRTEQKCMAHFNTIIQEDST